MSAGQFEQPTPASTSALTSAHSGLIELPSSAQEGIFSNEEIDEDEEEVEGWSDGNDESEGEGEDESEEESEDEREFADEGYQEDDGIDESSEDEGDLELPPTSPETTPGSSLSLWNARVFAVELVKLILDEAEYWPVLACTSNIGPRQVTEPYDGNPIQNATGPEPYSGAKTWFQAAIIRGLGGGEIDRPDKVARAIQGSSTQNTSANASENTALDGAFQVPNPWRSGSKVWHLQRNLRAWWEEALHEITWTDQDDPEKKDDVKQVLDETGTGLGYGFVRQLAPGDRIAIYVRARDGCWVNYVRAVEIRVHYSI
ncbi:hypothetical protein EST38_g11534 [Candolleomyces aberdarensis]|uniref:Uncharacterized protein n=1 Tax=Candolleomyces aberdarensis TaxID=2316362 RepID=A0A4Q2D4M1_9AGAR|nr:hypothetical protein EST38_g11534 [Candolleomyces aberdarensis]